jgi:hypothetical protein
MLSQRFYNSNKKASFVCSYKRTPRCAATAIAIVSMIAQLGMILRVGVRCDKKCKVGHEEKFNLQAVDF